MQKNKVMISVICPVYNSEKYLRRCLDSVLNQTFHDWELICVNDGSSDNSAAILDEYAARDSRVRVINKKNGGASDARNYGMRAARGKYVFFLDSDDFIHPQIFEITSYIAEKNNDDMVVFQIDSRFYRNTRKLMLAGKNISDKLPDLRNRKYEVARVRAMQTDSVLYHSTERNHTLHVRRPVRRHCYPVLGLYRRDLIKDIAFIKGIILEDFPWWSAVMLRRPQTAITNLPLYFYMPNASSALNSTKALRMIESIVVGLKYTFDLYSKNATASEFSHFKREFLWPFIIIAMRKVCELEKADDVNIARRAIGGMNSKIFENPSTARARKYARRIQEFLNS